MFIYALLLNPFLFSLICSDLVVTGKKAREREQKWLKMLDNWEDWITRKQPKVCNICMSAIAKCQVINLNWRFAV